MQHLTYVISDDIKIPAHVTRGAYTTPVWIQKHWEDGEYADYIRRNGCGHCCAAMALCLHGVQINPYEEYELCRALWGAPRAEDPYCQDHFASISGITKIMAHFGVPAEYFGVPHGGSDAAAEKIENYLREGKLVIFWSSPKRYPDNPFSSGSHYVLAAGITAEGKILIANSGSRTTAKNGIHLTDRATIARALFEGSTPEECTWGRRPLPLSGGCAVIG